MRPTPVEPAAPGIRREAAGILLGVIAAGLFVLFEFMNGGFAGTVWLPAGIFLLGLLTATAVARPELGREVPRATLLATALLASFAAWSFLSIGWAYSRGDAWDGANRTMLYLTIYVLFAFWPWGPLGAITVLTTFALGATASGLVAAAVAARAEDPLEFFFGARFAEPLGYHNASAALLLMAFWPAVVLGSRRELPAAVRAVLLAAATAALAIAFITQSRGSLIGFAAAAALALLIVPGRLRLLLALVAVAAAFLFALQPLVDVYRAAREGEAAAALEEAVRAIAVATVVALIVGFALAIVDGRVRWPARASRVLGAALATLAAAALVGAAVVAVRAGPVDRVADAWDSFRSAEPVPAGSTYYTSGLGSNRYDFWRVALGEFAARPLQGIGSENFAIPYLAERESNEETRFAHSLELEVLSQTGLVGAALLASFFLAALVTALPALRSAGLRGAAAAAAIVASGYWFTHASGDWLWEFPGLTGPALGFLGLAAGLRRPDQPPRRVHTVIPLVVGVAVVAACSFAFPWAALKEREAAAARWRNDPSGAYDRLERARRLNPLSERPDLLAGAIASRHRDWPRMRASFERALDRNPYSWYAELQLAVVASIERRWPEALTRVQRVAELNPREPTVRIVRMRIQARRVVPPRVLDRLFLERFKERTT